VRFLVDHCAGRRVADWLREKGHDVLEARELGPDPGDRALLAKAAAEERVLVTLDKHFGRFVFLERSEQAGLIRLPDLPAAERIRLVEQILTSHGADLEARKVVTVRGSRIRVSAPPHR
jgi:predicted nuclease of predicted toxin-antitoxin system